MIIAIANQKGGVSKTTTTAALATGLKNKGYKVLAIDLDAQGNLSDSAGAECQDVTIYDVMKGNVAAKDAIQHLDAFDCIPANILLASADLEFTATGKEYKLKESLSPIVGDYDFIVLDTPPALSIMTVNAFTAADEVIIPSTPGIFAASGIAQLFKSIETVRKYCNPKLRIDGILLTRFNSRHNIGQDIKSLTEQAGEHINARVYDTHIRSSVAVEEAQALKMDIYSYNPKNNVTLDYTAWVDEYLEGVKERG